MASLYSGGYYNNINIVNPYNLVNSNTNVNNYSSMVKMYSPIVNNPPKVQYINQNNSPPFLYEEEKTSINQPLKNLYNNNTFQINRIVNQYQVPIANINYNSKKIPRFYSKPGENIIFTNNNYLGNNNQPKNIQRSNTVNYNPRLTAIPKANHKFYYNLINNNLQSAGRRTVSNNNRLFTSKNNNSQLNKTLNNIKVVHINHINNNDNKIPLNNKNNFPNLVEVTKITNNSNNNNLKNYALVNENRINNIKQIKIENNENLETNNDNYKKNNEANKSEEIFMIAPKVTKIMNEKQENYRQIKDIDLFDNTDEFIQHHEQMKSLEKSSKNPLINDKINQFAYSAHLPNTVKQLNNSYDIPNIYSNINIYNNNINYTQQNTFDNIEKQEKEHQKQPLTPLFKEKENQNQPLISLFTEKEHQKQPLTPLFKEKENQNQPLISLFNEEHQKQPLTPLFTEKENQNQPLISLLNEKKHQNQTVAPFLTDNSEIMSNTKCYEYYRTTINSPVTSYGYSQDQNTKHRNYMEDEGRAIENFNGDPNKILFCLFDGHGGGQVSKFLQENFGKYMKKILNYNNMISGFTLLFKAIDEDIKKLNCPNVGSTATIVYIEKLKENNKRILYCANVGDSRCVLVSKNGVYRLSYDDRVKDPQESERINKNGGIIVNNRVYGQLMLSRSFGDWRIKDVGVIVDPHIIRYELTDDDSFCVIASDGVWDVLKDEECSVLEKMYVNTGEMSKKIITECLRRNSFDNLSCFVIKKKKKIIK